MNFIKKHYKKLLFFLIIFILLVSIGISSGESGRKNDGIFCIVISSMQKMTFNLGQTLANSFYSVQEIVKMREENILLTDTVHELEEKVRILENVVSKSDALEAEYQIKSSIQYDYVIGQVIALDASNWFSRFTIDKGEQDGIKVNDIVIHGVEKENGMVQIGLVGLVTEIGPNWSKIITLLDETYKISFTDVNTDESGILQGSIDGTVSGYFFDSKATASPEDSIVSSGIGKVYFPDLYIGKISDVKQTTDASAQKIIVEPAVDFTKLSKVFVLKVNR